MEVLLKFLCSPDRSVKFMAGGGQTATLILYALAHTIGSNFVAS